MRKIIDKHWNLLSINPNIRNAFLDKPVVAYKRNKNLRDLIGSNKLFNNKVIRSNNMKRKQQLYCSPCKTRRDNLCCQQVVRTNTFTSYRTGETYKIFHQVNCKSQGIIYLLQCKICSIQYIGKSETPFNIRLNNHRKDSKKKDSIVACTHFQKENHQFQRDAKFTIIEKVTKNCTTSEELRLLLKKRENFWIIKLKTLHPYGLNQELNEIDC